jgi:hypothetical protein
MSYQLPDYWQEFHERIEEQMERFDAERERWETSVAALKRCQQAGVSQADIEHLSRECGIDPRFITYERKSA